MQFGNIPGTSSAVSSRFSSRISTPTLGKILFFFVNPTRWSVFVAAKS